MPVHNDSPVLTKRRKRDARFIEIAEEAGVSESTVNRVLNERGSVSEAARLRVIEAARKLSVKRLLPDVLHGLTHIDILISLDDTPLLKRISAALTRVIQMLDKRTIVHRIVVPDVEHKILNAIQAERHKRNGLIVMTRSSDKVIKALQHLIENGTPVITLLTDIKAISRTSYTGIDNLQAGRTAAWFISRMCKSRGRVLKLVANSYYDAHVERSQGFSEVLFTTPWLTQTEVQTHDDAENCYQAVKREMAAGDVVAIYNSGYGSEGILRALKEHDAVGKIMWVGHEMYDHHNQYLANGAMDLIIDQDPDSQVMAAVQHALFACGIIDSPPPSGPVEFRLFCPTNRRSTQYNLP